MPVDVPVDVTVRHINAGEGLQDYAREKASRLAEEFTRIEHIHVVLDIEKHRHSAELVIQAKNHIHVESLETSDNMRASIDLAVEKAEKQLRKIRDKIQSHRGRTSVREFEESAEKEA